MIAAQVGDVGEAVERRADARLTVHPAHDRQHLGEGVAGRFGAGALHVDDAAEVTVLGEHEVVAAAPGERQPEVQRVLGVAQAAGMDAVVAGVPVELGTQRIGRARHRRRTAGATGGHRRGDRASATNAARRAAARRRGWPAAESIAASSAPAHVGELVLEHGRTGRVLVGVRGDGQAPLEQSAARRHRVRRPVRAARRRNGAACRACRTGGRRRRRRTSPSRRRPVAPAPAPPSRDRGARRRTPPRRCPASSRRRRPRADGSSTRSSSSRRSWLHSNADRSV